MERITKRPITERPIKTTPKPFYQLATALTSYSMGLLLMLIVMSSLLLLAGGRQ